MSVSEKVAFLKGLYSGLEIKRESKEGLLYAAIIDALEEISNSVSELYDRSESIDEELSALDGDLTDLYECVHDGCDHDYDDGEEIYELVCPTCGEKICLEESMLEKGGMKCPACGEDLEFDTGEIEKENNKKD